MNVICRIVPYLSITSFWVISMSFFRQANLYSYYMNNVAVTLCLILFGCYQINAAEKTTIEADNEKKIVEERQKPEFGTHLPTLQLTNSANKAYWLELNNDKTLILQHEAKGKLYRGSLLLFHAQGENADHPRIVRPLAKQFANLGWQVLIPNMPIEDFPDAKADMQATKAKSNPTEGADNNQVTKTEDSKEKSSNKKEKPTVSSEPTKKSHFYSSSDEYQQFVNHLVTQLIQNATPSNNIVLVANQNAGYWILDGIKNANELTQIVLIDPQQPANLSKDLKSGFQNQSLPVYTFISIQDPSSSFMNMENQKLWKNQFKRQNNTLFLRNGIQNENIWMAKTITGWIKSQEKTK